MSHNFALPAMAPTRAAALRSRLGFASYCLQALSAAPALPVARAQQWMKVAMRSARPQLRDWRLLTIPEPRRARLGLRGTLGPRDRSGERTALAGIGALRIARSVHSPCC
jgi:hypothetical protein